MFKNKQWSAIGELKTATHQLNAVYINGKFFISGRFLSNIGVYEFKNGNATFKKNAGSYNTEQFGEGTPLFLVNENFCT